MQVFDIVSRHPDFVSGKMILNSVVCHESIGEEAVWYCEVDYFWGDTGIHDLDFGRISVFADCSSFIFDDEYYK